MRKCSTLKAPVLPAEDWNRGASGNAGAWYASRPRPPGCGRGPNDAGSLLADGEVGVAALMLIVADLEAARVVGGDELSHPSRQEPRREIPRHSPILPPNPLPGEACDQFRRPAGLRAVEEA